MQEHGANQAKLCITASLWRSLVAALLLMAGCSGEKQTVNLQVVTPAGLPVKEVVVEVTHLGDDRRLRLQRPAMGPDQQKGDRSWSGAFSPRGQPTLLSFRIIVSVRDTNYIYISTLPIYHGETALAWRIIEPDNPKHSVTPQLTRIPRAASRAAVAREEGLRTAVHLACQICVLLLVLWSVYGARPALPGVRDEPLAVGALSAPGVGGWLRDAAIWLVVATVWTWPAATAGPGLWVGRHFDTLGTGWVIDAWSRLLPGTVDQLTGWPLRPAYRHLDSAVLMAVSAALQWMHPARVHGLLQVLGVAVSALAAQRLARAVGARPPCDMLAGLAFGFSGLMASPLLEGQVYFVLLPWLPLFAWLWWRATGPQGTGRDGILASLAYCAVLFTSSYIGIAGAIIAVGFLAGHVVRERSFPWRAALAAAALPALAAASLFWWYVDDRPVGSQTLMSIGMASGHLANLAGPTLETDVFYNSMCAALSPVVLALFLVAGVTPLRPARLRTLQLTALVSLILGLGVTFSATLFDDLFDLPTRWLLDTPASVALRFPMRLAHAWTLCAGVLAALVASGLSHGARHLAWVLLLLAAAHAFGGVDMPRRQRAIHCAVPSAYKQGKGPILDLFPVVGKSHAGSLEIWFTGLVCAYQIEHQRPIAERCLDSVPQSSPRYKLGRRMIMMLQEMESRRASDELAAMGFSAVAFHPDFFIPVVRARIDKGLAGFGTRRVTSRDGSEEIIIQPVPPPASTPSAADRARAYRSTGLAEGHSGEVKDLTPILARRRAHLTRAKGGVARWGWGIYALLALCGLGLLAYLRRRPA